MLAPIPGASLTRAPRNSPWEQPPMFVKKEEALAYYFKKLNRPETLDDMLFLLKRKYPLEVFVDTMTSYGVMEGYHTIDVKNLISPILHEHIKNLCEALDIPIVEWGGPSEDEKQSEKDKKRMEMLIQEALENPSPASSEEVEEAAEALEGSEEPIIKKRA